MVQMCLGFLPKKPSKHVPQKVPAIDFLRSGFPIEKQNKSFSVNPSDSYVHIMSTTFACMGMSQNLSLDIFWGHNVHSNQLFNLTPIAIFPMINDMSMICPWYLPCYPLVNVYITIENHHASWENSLFLWWFPIVLWQFTRG